MIKGPAARKKTAPWTISVFLCRFPSVSSDPDQGALCRRVARLFLCSGQRLAGHRGTETLPRASPRPRSRIRCDEVAEKGISHTTASLLMTGSLLGCASPRFFCNVDQVRLEHTNHCRPDAMEPNRPLDSCQSSQLRQVGITGPLHSRYELIWVDKTQRSPPEAARFQSSFSPCWTGLWLPKDQAEACFQLPLQRDRAPQLRWQLWVCGRGPLSKASRHSETRRTPEGKKRCAEGVDL